MTAAVWRKVVVTVQSRVVVSSCRGPDPPLDLMSGFSRFSNPKIMYPQVQVLNISKDGDYTISLGNLVQCSVTLILRTAHKLSIPEIYAGNCSGTILQKIKE
ncbi:hypothetical protein WISP_05382 [Willisornis vidua]|uniref:Uncharacterized protein n=1 Tax=Willisornis vidua TaxID=1566151 RepID=A0ABQ9DTR6_9PASS|nr:hypothetical protein WISP_05382 [Willisornis vidua]